MFMVLESLSPLRSEAKIESGHITLELYPYHVRFPLFDYYGNLILDQVAFCSFAYLNEARNGESRYPRVTQR